MKNFKLFVSVFAIAATFIQCAPDADVSSDELQENLITTQILDPALNDLLPDETSGEVLGKLEAMGFNTEEFTPKRVSDGVMVHGDIVVTNETIEEFDMNNRQAFFRFVNCNRVNNIRIENRMGNTVQGRAFQRGVNLWNRVNGTTLRLIPVTSNPDIVVRLGSTAEIGSNFGVGEFPSNGVEGGLIRINSNRFGLNRRQWGNIIAHEIGHNIGIVHSTDDTNPAVTFVNGTPVTDPLSIMTAGGATANVVLNAPRVSNGDRRAVRIAYNNSNNALCN